MGAADGVSAPLSPGSIPVPPGYSGGRGSNRKPQRQSVEQIADMSDAEFWDKVAKRRKAQLAADRRALEPAAKHDDSGDMETIQALLAEQDQQYEEQIAMLEMLLSELEKAA